MTYEEAKVRFNESNDSFGLINTASHEARPPVVRHWLDYPLYRSAYGAAWSAITDHPEPFEEDSPLDGLAYGAFCEGWQVALERVGKLIGIDPERFRTAVELLGEIERDDLPAAALERLRRDTTDEAFDLGVVTAFDEYPPDDRAHYARIDGGESGT